jgi:hypothetical protein
MMKAFALFFLVFSLLSLMVHQDGLVRLFGVGALSLFTIDQVVARFTTPRPARMRGEPLL